MSIQDTVALVFGITGFIIGVFAIIISWESLNTNKESAKAAGASAKAAQRSAETSEKAIQHQLETHEESKSAKLVRLDDWSFDIPVGKSARIRIPVFNEGPAVARLVQMFVSRPGSTEIINDSSDLHTPRSDPVDALYPFERAVLEVTMFDKYFENSDLREGTNNYGLRKEDHFNCWIVYHDGRGPHEMRLWIMVEGSWGMSWMHGVQDAERWPTSMASSSSAAPNKAD